MTVHLDIKVEDKHLDEATSASFNHSLEVIDDLRAALNDQRRRSKSFEHRKFMDRLFDRFITAQHYWTQLQQDYEQGLTHPRHNVKTFVEVVKDAAHLHGYNKGREESHSFMFNDGYAEGYADGADVNPWHYAALGFVVAIVIAVVFRSYIPVIF